MCTICEAADVYARDLALQRALIKVTESGELAASFWASAMRYRDNITPAKPNDTRAYPINAARPQYPVQNNLCSIVACSSSWAHVSGSLTSFRPASDRMENISRWSLSTLANEFDLPLMSLKMAIRVRPKQTPRLSATIRPTKLPPIIPLRAIVALIEEA